MSSALEINLALNGAITDTAAHYSVLMFLL